MTIIIFSCNLFCGFGENEKEEMCIGQKKKSISRMKIYTDEINPRLDQMLAQLHYKEKQILRNWISGGDTVNPFTSL